MLKLQLIIMHQMLNTIMLTEFKIPTLVLEHKITLKVKLN